MFEIKKNKYCKNNLLHSIHKHGMALNQLVCLYYGLKGFCCFYMYLLGKVISVNKISCTVRIWIQQ